MHPQKAYFSNCATVQTWFANCIVSNTHVVQGPILAFIYAVKEMMEEGQATQTALPVNVAFVFEGEEENGQSAYYCLLAMLCAARAACD